MVDHLPNKCEALNSTPNMAKGGKKLKTFPVPLHHQPLNYQKNLWTPQCDGRMPGTGNTIANQIDKAPALRELGASSGYRQANR
jgi:hypothetical protein